jgi:hypothetical protein
MYKTFSSTDDLGKLIKGSIASMTRHDLRVNNLSCKRVEDGPPDEEECTEPNSAFLVTGVHHQKSVSEDNCAVDDHY